MYPPNYANRPLPAQGQHWDKRRYFGPFTYDYRWVFQTHWRFLNITLPAKEEEPRKDDPFLQAMFSYQNPILDFIHKHEHTAIHALSNAYPDFEKALESGKIGYIAMIARSAELHSEHTFELFAASFEHFKKHGYEYMMITGTNQWTGAACEALGSARIYFWPFRDKQRVADEKTATQNEPYSSDGFISNKDSGLMIFALKL